VLFLFAHSTHLALLGCCLAFAVWLFSFASCAVLSGDSTKKGFEPPCKANMTSWCLLFVCYKRLHAGEQQHPCTLTTLAECKQAMQLSLLECTCGANDSLIGYSTFGSKEMERVTHNVSKLYIRTDLGRICPWCHAPS